MSMGGDFYALSDKQLESMLDGSLDYAEFLYDELEDKPREVYADGEYLWLELTRLLSDERACGAKHTDKIPEASGYAFYSDVASIAQGLSKLSEDELKSRYDDDGDIEASFEEVLGVVQGLTAFYVRAASNGDAVLFRVT